MVMRSPRPTPPAPVVRTCVGCRARAAKSDLLRVVARGDEIVPDPRARLPGRGAYLHLSQKCFEQAVRRRAFARALRSEEHTSELQSRPHLVCRLLLEKKKNNTNHNFTLKKKKNKESR